MKTCTALSDSSGRKVDERFVERKGKKKAGKSVRNGVGAQDEHATGPTVELEQNHRKKSGAEPIN